MSKSLERGSSAPLIKTGAANQLAKDVNPLEMASEMGHEFARKSYYKPTYCHHCSELLWGLINQGFQCSICNMNCHERCLPLLVVDCVHVLAEKIVDPIAHKWIGPKSSFKKKKWCNTCRLRIYGQAKYCQICRRYAHINCTAHSLNNCKNPSTYTSVANVLFEHHWIEGNLTSSAKCEVCGKSCSSDLSLTGFHCGWCGVTVHSSCFDFYTSRYKTCDFRDLIYMIVPPNSVSLPIKESSLVDDDVVDEMDVPQLFQPSDEGDSPTKGRQVIFIDSSGTCSTKLRKRTLHPFRVDHKMTCEDLLRVGLRKCNIPLDIEGLYLSTVDSSMKEREIYPQEIIYSLPQTYAGPLKVYIRKRDITREYKLKIFNSKLKSGVPHVNVIINDNTCVGDIINSAVMLFELEDDDPTGYCIYETNQAKGIYEKMLDVNEKPWASVRQLEIVT
jgi:diacylglycerol kinase (ATP)